LRVQTRRKPAEDLRRRLNRLDGLPLRPITARSLVGSLPDEPGEDDAEEGSSGESQFVRDLDPGWILGVREASRTSDQLRLVAERSWWRITAGASPFAEVIDRLWRHSVAVGLGARRLAREAGDPDPHAVARAGQLCSLGWWAVAAVEPDWLVSWWAEADRARRDRLERAELGSDLADLGRRLAERWGCEPLTIDAAWLHSDHDHAMSFVSDEPGRLALIQQAYRWAEQTPWSLGHAGRETAPSDPRVRILMAEVQARCASPFVDPAATQHEERVTRQNARLRLLVGQLRAEQGQAGRFLELLAGTQPGESPDEWADRAALAWCAEPGVGSARVGWHAPEASSPAAAVQDGAPSDARRPVRESDVGTPDFILPLNDRGPMRAVAELGRHGEPKPRRAVEGPEEYRGAWAAWARLVGERSRLERRLQAAIGTLRDRIQSEDERLRLGKMEALGEFAAGAGHELNNPLAVIVGRAQLLLARSEDPDVARSLRIILGQAQRAHRIIRDLMFVARPPAPRPRAWKPPELLGAVVSEFEPDCQSRGVRLIAEMEESPSVAWGDPDALKHLASILLRNALQAAAPGGRIVVRSTQRGDELTWSVADNGRGIRAEEAEHLFDPFYCGRKAGRGLGLGLPRAARIVEQAGGRIRWSSGPGPETIFQVSLPLVSPPEQPAQPAANGLAPYPPVVPLPKR
jgi:signal transduction histidine kinase